MGVGYRPRTGAIFFTRNGKKLDEIAHNLKSQNFFPTVGANGPSTVHVNFGQSGFVFIEANVKKWGLAPMTGVWLRLHHMGANKEASCWRLGEKEAMRLASQDIRGVEVDLVDWVFQRAIPDLFDRIRTSHSPNWHTSPPMKVPNTAISSINLSRTRLLASRS